jgi:hypothetical protein
MPPEPAGSEALGSLVESDAAVRDAAYLRRTGASPELP